MRNTVRSERGRTQELLTQWLKSALLLLMALVLVRGSLAVAQVATTYSSNKRTLKVGILLLDSTIIRDGGAEELKGPENPDPFVFYIADTRADIKPQNWEFVNPLSPKVVSSDAATRWAARTAGNGPQYQVGQQVTKNMACYWEVPLTDTPLQDLLQFDLLFITNHRTMRFSAPDREKLRKLVDAGGILWIEDCGGMRIEGGTAGGDPPGPFLLDQLQFNGGRADSPGPFGVPGPIINVPNHPILTSPYPLSQQEIANIGDKNYYNYALTNLYDATRAPNPETLVNIVGNAGRNNLPYIAAGTYGAGRIIATAGDSGCDINDYCGGLRTNSGGNSGAYCGENLQTAHGEDLKFLYNLVAWGSANSQYRKDPRRTASSFEDIGAPLLKSFEISPLTSIRPTDVVDSKTAPLVAKGIIYSSGMVGGTPVVRAYSAHPSLVLGDRGFPDLALGSSYDELWRWDGAGGHPSSPVLATIFNGAAVPNYQDFIFVTLSDGSLVKLTALLADNFGNIAPAPLAGINAPTAGGTYTDANGNPMPAPAPVVHEGKIYVVQPDGLVRCVNATDLTTLWISYSANQTVPYKPVGSPTLGYTRMAVTGETSTNAIRLPNGRSSGSYAANSNGSTNDLMLYVPVWQEDPNTGIRSLRTMAYWLGTRHEVIVTDDQALGAGMFRTRAGLGAPANSHQYVAINPGYPGASPAGYPFIRPVVRVYTNAYNGAGDLVATATDNMAAGQPNANFIGRFLDKNGVVRVEDAMGNPPTRGTVAPGNTPNNAIVSVDYDVYYIDVVGMDTPPALTQDNSNASRPVPALRADGYISGGEGIAMTPDDILVSAFNFRNPAATNARPITAIAGDYEQYGINAKLRQSVLAFENPTPLVPLQIGNTSLVEIPTFRNRLRFAAAGGGNLSTGAVHLPQYEGLLNILPVGPPITTNDGVTYQVLSATSPQGGPGGGSIPVTVVAALDMNKEVVLNLPEAYNPSYRVQLEQLDAASFDPTNPQQAPAVRATLQQSAPNSISVSQQMTGDASRGRIVITDMRVTGRRFSSSLSFIVTYVPAGGTTDKTVVLTPTPLLPDSGPGNEVDAVENGGTRLINGGYSPILWYYTLPGNPTSAPTLSGNSLYLGLDLTPLGGTNAIVAVDANPASNDPNVRLGLGQQVETVVPQIDGATQKINHVRWVRGVAGQIQGAPVGAQGVLAVNTTVGLAAFETGVTLIADAKRIIEVDASGAALWTLDGTLDFKGVGGELPIGGIDGAILNPGATGRILNDKKPLSHPSVARRLSASDYLICDTGNNRVIRVDRSGVVRWQLDRVNDPFHVLASVDPLTLNEPLDVQVYTQPTPGVLTRAAGSPLIAATAIVGYEAHYLVADSGNSRIIEVVDYFDANGNVRTIPTPTGNVRGEQVVVWVSRTLQKEGRNLRFQSVQRILTTGDVRKLANPDTRLQQDPALYGYPVIIAAVGNSSAAGDAGGGAQADFTGGSLIALDYFPLNTAFPLFNSTTGVYTGSNYGAWLFGEPEPSRNGLVDRTLNEIVMPLVAGQRLVRKVTRPTFIQQITLPNGLGGQKPAFLLCDATGVYQVELNAADQRWYVSWYFDANDYALQMAARLAVPGVARIDVGFQPTSVKRLANGSYLITNAWTGKGTKPDSLVLPIERSIGQLMSSGQFVGEVFQVTGIRKFDAATGALLDGALIPGFDSFSAPQLVITVDAFGNRRYEQKMGGVSNNTNLLEHPLFGDRL